MKKETNINKETIIQAVINQINENAKPEKIETNYFSGYQSPDKFQVENTDKVFVPDIIANYKNESKRL